MLSIVFFLNEVLYDSASRNVNQATFELDSGALLRGHCSTVTVIGSRARRDA
jgi:hypothetical protein